MTHYEHGERASKLLCHQLRQSTVDNLVTEITTPEGNTISDQVAINNQFRAFYANLYSSDIPTDSCSTDFFRSLQLTVLSSEEASSLDGGVSETEINQAITLMGSGKAPGPDGFPIEFYKKFSDQLSPLLCKVYAEALQLGSLPPTMSQAIISVLLKKGKKPTLCDSYRPISLVF